MAEVKEIGFAHSTNGGWMHIVRYMGKVQMKGTRYGVMEILTSGKGVMKIQVIGVPLILIL